MKAKISISVLLMILLTSLLTVMGQEKTDKNKQEEDAQKKKEQVTVILDTKKDAHKELQKAMEESLASEEKALKARKELGILDDKTFFREAEALQTSKEKLEQLKMKNHSYGSTGNYSYVPQIRWNSDESGAPNIYSIYGNERENTSLSISKTLEDVTSSTDFYYDVKEESSRVSFYVSGSLKAGELKIILKRPDKTAFQEITISPLADVNWNQQFSWDNEESEGYLGKWIISISGTKANGTYRVQVNSR